MSQTKRKKAPVFKSPAGIFVFPHLHAPDTKFNAAGVYGTKLQMSASEAASLVEQLEQEHAKAVALAKEENPKAAKKMKEGPLPFDVDEDTGDVTFRFKMNATGVRQDKTPYTQRPALFDAAGTPLPPGTKIGGGTRGIIAFSLLPYYTALAGAGVTLRLKAVQVLDLKTWGENNAASYGFGKEEGFSADELSEDNIFSEKPAAVAAEGTEPDATQDASDF